MKLLLNAFEFQAVPGRRPSVERNTDEVVIVKNKHKSVGSMFGWDVPGADPANDEIEDSGPQMGRMTLE